MGNCTASKLVAGDEDETVVICRERKKHIKAAVQRRYALADAHARYTHSLCSVAAAINLFVTRHSTPGPMLIALPPSSSQPSFLQHAPSEPKTEAAAFRSSSSSCLLGEERTSGGEMEYAPPDHPTTLGEGGVAELGGDGEMGRASFLPGTVFPPSPLRSFGWDFFDPFGGVGAAEEAAMMAGLVRSSDEELRAVREEEGIPELEEDENEERGEGSVTGGEQCEPGKVVASDKRDEMVTVVEERSGLAAGGGKGVGEEKVLAVMGTPPRERELLDALRDVEDHFIRAYDSGKEVSRMLEAANRAPLQSGLEDVKENSSKLVQAITWHRSPSSRSSSKSCLAPSSSSTCSWPDGKFEMLDDYVGMESGSHSQTLGRLYAWEKKLYEEVKAGDQIRRLYERKCSQLRNQDDKGLDPRFMGKARSAVKELYTRILVTMRTVETISGRIEKLRVEELQPQLIELLQG